MPKTKPAITPANIETLAKYLQQNGFSGNIPQNNRAKNWAAIKKLLKRDPFYTFGIKRVHLAAEKHEITAVQVRDILVKSSGLNVKRFNFLGPGYFDPNKSAEALLRAWERIETAAEAGGHIIFATGHPGAMVGLLQILADAAKERGAHVSRLRHGLPVQEHHFEKEKRHYLDQIGDVFVPSDNCSAWHSHSASYGEMVLRQFDVDLLVGDHGFVGAAINEGVSCIGFYDTDDPAIPLAASLGMPVIGVPLNDNRYNADSAALGRYLVEHHAA